MTARRWSADVTEHSDALDLDEGVFKKTDPADIAASLKRSAEQSHRKKGTVGYVDADLLHQPRGRQSASFRSQAA